jgi:hypothetical protein
MEVPIEFLRGVLGIIAVGCAYMTGRTAATVRKGWHKPSRLYGWIIRLTLCLGAVAFRHPVDGVELIVWALSAGAFGFAMWDISREKKEEEMPRISPDE